MGFLHETFLQNALLAAALSGALCAFLGVYVHLKRIVFIGITLSEVAAFGIAAGLYLGLRPEATASLLTVSVALLFWRACCSCWLFSRGIRDNRCMRR